MTDHPPTRERRSRVALVTCDRLPELEPDDQLLASALRARSVAAVPAVWDDPRQDWSALDLAVLRSPWDYPDHHARFLAWARQVPRLANPAATVGWNTDKRYLSELAAAGVPVVPTGSVAPTDRWRPPDDGDWVIKPVVGAGGRNSGRYRLDDRAQRELAEAHVTRLQRQQRAVLVQPYQPEVDTYGETGLVFLADPARGDLVYSHAIRKGPMLTGPDRGGAELYLAEEITARTPTEAELAVAGRALAAVPGGTAGLLYARVDLIPGPDGVPLLVELELTEPSLFLGYADGAADRLADAILAHLSR